MSRGHLPNRGTHTQKPLSDPTTSGLFLPISPTAIHSLSLATSGTPQGPSDLFPLTFQHEPCSNSHEQLVLFNADQASFMKYFTFDLSKARQQ